MKRFDLYGACRGSLQDVRDAIEQGLGSEFALHESGFLGGEYFRSVTPAEEILIQANTPDQEGYSPEPEFKEWAILVYVNDSTRWDEVDRLMSRIGALTRLRSEEA